VSENTRQKLLAGLQKRDSSILADPHMKSLSSAIRKSQSPISKEKIYDIPINDIEPNPFQYRKEESLNQSELESLANSIAKQGQRTPIQLRRKGEKLILVAGWRRLTAIKRYIKSMSTVRATIDEEMDDATHRLLTIVENEQREDFSVFERAMAYKDLIDKDGYTQQQIGDLVGASKSRVSRTLKVLSLPEPVLQNLVSAQYKGLSEGHIDELVAGFDKRQGRGEDAEKWVLEMLNQIMSNNLSIEDIRNENRDLADKNKGDGITKGSKKPLKKWIIEGKAWDRFEVSTRNKVTLEFKLPEEIQFNESLKIIKYIKNQLMKSNGIS
jgi:ParB family transcriptional regulator, chromosome partitioning protein